MILLVILALLIMPTNVYAVELLNHNANVNRIIGEVRNNDTEFIGDINIEAMLYDNDGVTDIKHAYGEDKLAPGEKTVFTIGIANTNATSYDVLMEWKDTEFEEMSELLVENAIIE